MVDLRANPYFLDDEGCQWVRSTLAGLSLREKLGQMICACAPGSTNEELLELYNKIPVGGMMYRGGPAKQIKENSECLQQAAKVPLVLAANLEEGGDGVCKDGTYYASHLEAAATGDVEYARQLGQICGAEAISVGVNYSFAPVVDVHFNWRNPIIKTRTFGSDPDWVLACSKAYLKGIFEYPMAVSIKHFPGDGVDERDQHLVSSVNSLSMEEWDASFGKIYGELIKDGAQTVMVGHILQPAYSRHFRPGIPDRDIMPASLAPELLQDLLRGKLGFNGVIISDSCTMTGMACLPRRQIPAACINAGCDMYLFGRNLEEDFEYLMEDAETGVIPTARIDEAVTRILALKASLGLHKMTAFTREDYADIVGCEKHHEMARQCADKAITLVKDTQKLLPISPETHKRVWLHILGDEPSFRGGYVCREEVKEALEKAGFQVTLFEIDQLNTPPVRELKETYDLILYVANVTTGTNNSVNRIKWVPKISGESPQYTHDIPTMFVSIVDPYHFIDVPMIRTFINCYGHSPEIIESLMDKLTGKSPFEGKSPVDPFCGGVWGMDF